MKKPENSLKCDQSKSFAVDIEEKIVLSAIKLFNRTPHHYVTLEEISNDAAVTLSLTNYYFKNKDNLYRVAFERAISHLDESLRRMNQRIDHKYRMKKNDAIEILSDYIGLIFDTIYGNGDNPDSHGKIFLYELASPTRFHEEFHEKYFKNHFKLCAKLIRGINKKMNHEMAVYQAVAILGEIFSFMVQKELIANMLYITSLGPTEISRFKKMTVQHAICMISEHK